MHVKTDTREKGERTRPCLNGGMVCAFSFLTWHSLPRYEYLLSPINVILICLQRGQFQSSFALATLNWQLTDRNNDCVNVEKELDGNGSPRGDAPLLPPFSSLSLVVHLLLVSPPPIAWKGSSHSSRGDVILFRVTN